MYPLAGRAKCCRNPSNWSCDDDIAATNHLHGNRVLPWDPSPSYCKLNILNSCSDHNNDCFWLLLVLSQTTACDGFSSSSADEGLADLQPEDSEGEEEGAGLKEDLPRTKGTWEQTTLCCLQLSDIVLINVQKLEFMAALNLVPPAVLEGTQLSIDSCNSLFYNLYNWLCCIQRFVVGSSFAGQSMATGGTGYTLL